MRRVFLEFEDHELKICTKVAPKLTNFTFFHWGDDIFTHLEGAVVPLHPPNLSAVSNKVGKDVYKNIFFEISCGFFSST